MDKFDIREEVKEYLMNNLSISVKDNAAYFGNCRYIKVTLTLSGEEISSDTFDLPETTGDQS